MVFVGTFCGCVLPNKELSEKLFEVNYFSEAEKAAPFISLRSDRKLFVVRARLENGAYKYSGKFFEVARGDMGELQRQALLAYKTGAESVLNCTNAIRLQIFVRSELGQREVCVTPGTNPAVDDLFDYFNQLITEADQRIIWK